MSHQHGTICEVIETVRVDEVLEAGTPQGVEDHRDDRAHRDYGGSVTVFNFGVDLRRQVKVGNHMASNEEYAESDVNQCVALEEHQPT